MKKEIKFFFIITLIVLSICFYLFIALYNYGIFGKTELFNLEYYYLLEFRINKLNDELKNSKNSDNQEIKNKINEYADKKEEIKYLYNNKNILNKDEKKKFKKMSKEFMNLVHSGRLSLEENEYIMDNL